MPIPRRPSKSGSQRWWMMCHHASNSGPRRRSSMQIPSVSPLREGVIYPGQWPSEGGGGGGGADAWREVPSRGPEPHACLRLWRTANECVGHKPASFLLVSTAEYPVYCFISPGYIKSIAHLAAPYGACKIIPPVSFRPECVPSLKTVQTKLVMDISVSFCPMCIEGEPRKHLCGLRCMPTPLR